MRTALRLQNSDCVLASRPAFRIISALLVGLAFPAQAAGLTTQQSEFFENKIRPVLVNSCYKCHSTQAEKIKGGLLLDSREGVLKGGDTGPAIVPGNAEKSLLIKAIHYEDQDLQMPPKGNKLPDEQIADLETWVKMGAPDPRVATAAQKRWIDSTKSHWAWQPLTKPVVPDAKDSSWCKTPVDNFIMAKLGEKGLKPNPPADKRSLIRRATFDLTGLPPTPEEVEDFLKDESADAFAKVVDRLLASPHYGECWGRHWLDVARYSDTKGQVRRQREDPNYPNAWTYRDYVIRSFNEDKPYNQFVVEQLASDKLPATRQNPTNLAALGFLTVGDHFMEMQNDIVNDRIDVTTKAFLGLTVTCARCHDHKFDPIPTKDYYSLHGIFSSCAEPAIDPVMGKIIDTPEYQDYYKQRMNLQAEKERLQAQLPQLRKARDREGIKKNQRDTRQNSGAIANLEMTHPGAPARAMAVYDLPKPHDSPVFIRGEAGNKGPLVQRHFLEVLSGPYRPPFTNGSGRLQLAQAIVSKTDPLTPRVMMNRVWQYHFGEGIVTTPDDFGTRSEPPSHPELLDYLAACFVEEGWSVKKMHRLIMLSSAYQESSADNPRYAELDPFNRLLWRSNIRRLEFEAVRDSILAIGGTLDKTMYGRPIDFEKQSSSTRRTIYGLVDRADVDDVMVNFDFANPDMPNGKRHDTIVPQQALFFMNSPLVVEQARRLVALPEFKDLTRDESRIRFLYDRIYQRLPQPEETQLGVEFITQSPIVRGVPAVEQASMTPANKGRPLRPNQQAQRQGGRNRNNGGSGKVSPLTPWEEYAQVLLEANETTFVN
jgi:Protein of unknown function (DUF1549)/Protein of unknown function (DUF1553)/Planctomycete cytochrome C